MFGKKTEVVTPEELTFLGLKTKIVKITFKNFVIGSGHYFVDDLLLLGQDKSDSMLTSLQSEFQYLDVVNTKDEVYIKVYSKKTDRLDCVIVVSFLTFDSFLSKNRLLKVLKKFGKV